MNGNEISVEQLFKDLTHNLELQIRAGTSGLNNVINSAELNRPGLAFAGFLDVFSHDRIQILGITEVSYLNSLPFEDRNRRMVKIFQHEIPCFIVTSGQKVPVELLEMCNIHHVPLLQTSLPTSRFCGLLSHYLERKFAPSCTVHGTLLDVFGLGVLIIGKAGVGKSETALELIEHGHRLVADDVVVLRRLDKKLLVGGSSEMLKHHMEIRGIGIIDVEDLFGVGSVRDDKKVSFIIRLKRWDDREDYERLGIDQKYSTIFDVKIPEYTIPVEPGRNLSILIQVAALYQRLKDTGRNPAAKFNEKLINLMRESSLERPPASLRLSEEDIIEEGSQEREEQRVESEQKE